MPSVLIVDDDQFNILVLLEMLTELGVESDSALTGHLALELIEARVKAC